MLELAMELLLRLKFQIASRPSTDADLAACLVALVQSHDNFRLYIFKEMSSWLPRFLLGDLPQARRNAVCLMTNLIRSDEFKDSCREPWVADDLYINNQGFKALPQDQVMGEMASSVLLFVLGLEPELIKLLIRDGKNVSAGATDDERAKEYLVLISNLLRVIPAIRVDWSPIVKLYETLLTIKQFHLQAAECLKIISAYQITISEQSLMSAFPNSGKRLKNDCYPLLCRFLPHFFSVLKRFQPSLDFVPTFMDSILFGKYELVAGCSSCITDYMMTLLGYFKDEMVDLFEDGLKKYVSRNYVMVLAFLEAVKLKKSLVTLVEPIFQKLVANNKINVNDVISKTIERSQRRTTDLGFYSSLLKREDLSDEVREKVSEIVRILE
jgi:hypothetical protein